MPRRETRFTYLPDDSNGSVMDRNLSSMFPPRRRRSLLSFISLLVGLWSSWSQSSMLRGCVPSRGSMGNLEWPDFPGFSGKFELWLIGNALSNNVAATRSAFIMALCWLECAIVVSLMCFYSWLMLWLQYEPSALFAKTLYTNNIWRDERRKNQLQDISHYTYAWQPISGDIDLGLNTILGAEEKLRLFVERSGIRVFKVQKKLSSLSIETTFLKRLSLKTFFLSDTTISPWGTAITVCAFYIATVISRRRVN